MDLMKVLMFVFVALVAVTFAQNNTGEQTATVSDGDVNERSSLEKGMEPIYKLYHNFLNTVMKRSFYDSDTPFNVNKLSDIIAHSNYGELQTDWRDLVSTYGGLAACIIFGMLFMVFMPLAGCIYCCCHCCCHKCGGTRATKDPKRAACMRATFAAILLVFATMVLVGSIITFLSANLLKKSLNNEDDKGLLTRVDINLANLKSFTNKTIQEVKNEARQKIMVDGLGQILPKVESAVNNTVEKIKSTINATDLLNQADNLGLVANKAANDIMMIQASLTNLTQLQTTINQTLVDVKSKIDTTCQSQGCSLDTSGLVFKPDFNNLGKLDSELNKTGNALKINDSVQKARDEFNNISRNVDAKVNRSIEDARKEIRKINNTVDTSVNKLDNQAQPFVDSLQRGRNDIKGQQDVFTKIGNYTWYICIGLGCAVLLVVAFYYLGVLFGLCGERPDSNAGCCNRGTGANLLCAGIVFSFLFACLLMLVVIVMFSVGGLGYTMACRYLNDGIENVKVFEKVLSDGFKWNISKSFNVSNLTIGEMFENCKANQGVYTALHLNQIFNLDNEFNVSDVKEQVRAMTSQTFTLDAITLLNPSLEQELKSYAEANLSGIPFDSYTTQLDANVTGVDLTQTIEQLKAAANKTGSTDLSDAATKLGLLQNTTLVELEVEKGRLRNAINSLRNYSNVNNQVNQLIDNIKDAQDNFNNNKENITKTQIGVAVEDILKVIDDTVSSTKDAIENKIGKCRPLYDAAQNVVNAVCIVTLDPFNCVWFGLGWSLFFYIPCIVFAALLSSLYQRSEKYVKKDKVEEQDLPGYGGYGESRQEDALPLTNTGMRDRDRSSGNYNQAYDNHDQLSESRFYRGEPRESRYDDSRYGSGRHVYDMPMTNRHTKYPSYESPPQYDEAVSSSYRHGGYPKDYRY